MTNGLFCVFHVQNAAGNPVSGALIDAGVWKGMTNACGDFQALLGAGHYVATISKGGVSTPRDWNLGSQPQAPILIELDVPSRPAAVQQPPLPEFDQDDPGGNVHTTCPPDQTVPWTAQRDKFKGDLGGVMLPTAPPFVDGANTTPPEMTMSFLLPKYVQFGVSVIDAFLTAHAERNYSHFHLDRWQFDAAGLGLAAAMDLIDYVQSWGFYTSFWACGTNDNRGGGWSSLQPTVEPFLRALVASQGRADLSVCLPGEELNNGVSPGPMCDSIIQGVTAVMAPAGVPSWLHFTSNYPGYPTNTPPPGVSSDDWLVQWIAQWNDPKYLIKGLAWQANQDNPAGLMGAKLWDARRFWYWANPAAKVAAFELMASLQLVGRCTEEYGCLRGLEMVYCTSDGTAGPVAGTMGGIRLPDGSPA